MTRQKFKKDFNSIFPSEIRKEFIFPFYSYQLFLERLTIDPFLFLKEWSDLDRQLMVEKYWHPNTKLDWKWSLTFPIFSLLEKYIYKFNNPTIIGFSGLPGSGKSSLGNWIDNVSRELNFDIKVISLDDFYLPGTEMDIAMSGNPWNVPRGFPGSHSIDLMNHSLDTFLKTGKLKSPIFDKSLRNGRGDRTGWIQYNPKVIVLEGWFVGCKPIDDLTKLNIINNDNPISQSLTEREKDYRIIIQKSLVDYTKIWNKIDKLIHLKSDKFNNTVLWKTQQEEDMLKLKGSALQGNELIDFIRMIQTSIPQDSLSFIDSDTTIEINKQRRIEKISSLKYQF